jgi:hypothetical protein
LLLAFATNRCRVSFFTFIFWLSSTLRLVLIQFHRSLSLTLSNCNPTRSDQLGFAFEVQVKALKLHKLPKSGAFGTQNTSLLNRPYSSSKSLPVSYSPQSKPITMIQTRIVSCSLFALSLSLSSSLCTNVGFLAKPRLNQLQSLLINVPTVVSLARHFSSRSHRSVTSLLHQSSDVSVCVIRFFADSAQVVGQHLRLLS